MKEEEEEEEEVKEKAKSPTRLGDQYFIAVIQHPTAKVGEIVVEYKAISRSSRS